MREKELRVNYLAGIFNARGGLALPLAMNMLKKLFEVVK
jgi:hypothetical protein